MKKAYVFALASVLVVACGDDDDDSKRSSPTPDDSAQPPAADAGDGTTRTITEPSSPIGTVSGQVLDTDLAPVVGANVELMIGSQTSPRAATVDDKGYFAFPGVPAGSQVLLAFSKEGYATIRATSVVPSSAGNVPLNNANASIGPVLLAKLDGTLRFRIALPNSQPAVGAVATLRASPSGTIILSNSDNSQSPLSVVTVTGVSDANGVVELKNVPSPTTLSRYQNAQYQLTVAPIDANADGTAETGGYSQTYQPSAIIQAGNLAVVNLPSPQYVP